MSAEARKAVVASYVEAFNAGDWPTLRRLFASNATIRGVLGWGNIDEVAMPVWKELHDGLQMKLAIDGLVADGEAVAARFTETGAFVGPFRGLAGLEPTGKSYELVAMEWFEFEDGLIARRWGARDSAAQRRMVTEG
ncbi:ester cyclase [Phenylobacterium soli]|uniref:Ester cyclase n=1 Tax=Phenylobacterium soli TaxID=2170551 RepID=A0A328AIR3_9CAUL|nr:nuclear transport factor 2 family protein [Phenylobacterium soli]RAK54397.1 ester cyclase [Phenylobacterium soli]